MTSLCEQQFPSQLNYTLCLFLDSFDSLVPSILQLVCINIFNFLDMDSCWLDLKEVYISVNTLLVFCNKGLSAALFSVVVNDISSSFHSYNFQH